MSEPSESILAVDLGGSRLRAARLDAAQGQIASIRKIDTPRGGPEPVVDAITALLAPLADGLDPSAPIGLACPGPLDPDSGRTHSLPNLPGFEDYPLADALSRRTGRACYLHNDASLAALGEAWQGAGQDADPLLYVTWSTGIGAGMVCGGRLFGGARGMAGEIGHLIVREGGPACGLGHPGCAEGLGSGSGLAARAATELGPPWSERAAIDTAALATAADAGDAQAAALLRDGARAFGLALAGAINLLDPARVVVGGGLALHAWPRLMPEVHAVLERIVLAWPERKIALVPAALGDDAGLVGAARHAWQRAGRAER